MIKCSWRYVAMVCMSICMWFGSNAQQEYFIFLQSDQQPFYARVGEKIFSSSAAGHVVLPGLRDSTYSIFIGFPKNQYPEMEFVIPLSKKDQGFQLKNMGDQGWNLFNFLTLQLLKPKVAAPKSGAFSPEIKKKTDDYSRLMAGVVNDTAVLYATFIPASVSEPVVKQPANVSSGNEKRAGTDTSIARLENGTPGDTVLVKTETTIAKSTDSTVNTKETVSVFRDSATKQSTIPAGPMDIVNIGEEKRSDGVHLKYVIRESTGNPDTVIAFIEYVPASEEKKDTVVATKQPTMNADTDPNNTGGRLVMINSDCRNFASERDVDKLRIKILSEKKDSEKLDVVKKEYRTKCYTSRQVKALSELFYQDPLRFEFLSASFPFVSDSENFRELVTLLRDPVYVEKFEGLFKN